MMQLSWTLCFLGVSYSRLLLWKDIKVGVSVDCVDIIRISESVGISLLYKRWHKILQVMSRG